MVATVDNNSKGQLSLAGNELKLAEFSVLLLSKLVEWKGRACLFYSDYYTMTPNPIQNTGKPKTYYALLTLPSKKQKSRKVEKPLFSGRLFLF